MQNPSSTSSAPLSYSYLSKNLFLSQEQYQQLSRNHTQEHSQRINSRICYCRSVVVSHLVGISQCRGVGRSTRKQTGDGAIVELIAPACQDAYHQHWNHGDKETIEHPQSTLCIEYGSSKVLTCCNTHRCQEEADTYLAQKQVGCTGGVGHQFEFISEAAHQDCHYKWSTGKTQLHRNAHSGHEDWN